MATAEVRRTVHTQTALDEAGDRFANGDWLIEVVDRLQADVFCDVQVAGEMLWSVAGTSPEEVRHGGSVTRPVWLAMSTLEAFCESHFSYEWQEWSERFVMEKAAEIHTESIGFMRRDEYEEAMSHYEDWSESLCGVTEEELEEMARADGLELVRGLVAGRA